MSLNFWRGEAAEGPDLCNPEIEGFSVERKIVIWELILGPIDGFEQSNPRNIEPCYSNQVRKGSGGRSRKRHAPSVKGAC